MDDYAENQPSSPGSEDEVSYDSSQEPGISEENPSQKDQKERQSGQQQDDANSQSSQSSRGGIQIIQQVQPDKPNQKRITSPFLTKYQKARIIGVRAVQISKNSPLYLNADSKSLMMWDPLTIAEKQLAQQKIPFIIRRYLPDGSYEDWKLSQLKTLD